MTVLIAALAISAGAVLGATFRAMYLADHGRHRPRQVLGHLHAPTALPRRWA